MDNTAIAQYRPVNAEGLPGHVNMLVYGRIGVGKTVLGATAPGPILFIDTDDGLLSVKKIRPELAEKLGVDAQKIYHEKANSWEELVRVVTRVKADSRKEGFFRTVVFDNLSTAQVYCMQQKLGLSVDRLPERTDWNLVLQQMRAIVLLVRNMPCHTLFIAHEQDKNGVYGPLIQGAAYKQIPGMVDLMARYELIDRPEDDGKGGKQATQVRALNFQPSSPVPGAAMGIEAKNRGGWMSRWEQPHFAQIIEKLFPSNTNKIDEKGSQ